MIKTTGGGGWYKGSQLSLLFLLPPFRFSAPLPHLSPLIQACVCVSLPCFPASLPPLLRASVVPPPVLFPPPPVIHHSHPFRHPPSSPSCLPPLHLSSCPSLFTPFSSSLVVYLFLTIIQASLPTSFAFPRCPSLPAEIDCLLLKLNLLWCF